MSRKRRGDALPRLVVGLIVIAAGVIFWLDHLGTIDARDYLELWPLAAIVMGLAHLPHRKWVGAVIWIAIGIYFGMPLIGLRHLQFWRIIGLWPLMISAGGAMLVVQALRGAKRETSLRAVAVMAGNVRKIGAQFKGGEAVAVMGGCELDFSAATIAGEAVLDVLAFWGGIIIRVPRSWDVVGHVTPILGGYEDKTETAPAGAPRLIVRGAVIGGGIDVRNPRENG